ncbi:MAG: hypothetical protein SOU32_09505 [Lachnospiraceae bacterium]|nr:hypothetical protein [Lachnospiraceae bacterium]
MEELLPFKAVFFCSAAERRLDRLIMQCHRKSPIPYSTGASGMVKIVVKKVKIVDEKLKMGETNVGRIYIQQGGIVITIAEVSIKEEVQNEKALLCYNSEFDHCCSIIGWMWFWFE